MTREEDRARDVPPVNSLSGVAVVSLLLLLLALPDLGAAGCCCRGVNLAACVCWKVGLPVCELATISSRSRVVIQMKNTGRFSLPSTLTTYSMQMRQNNKKPLKIAQDFNKIKY